MNIAYITEDGDTIVRLSEKGYISAEVTIDALVQISAEKEVWKRSEEARELFSGTKRNVSKILEDLALKQLEAMNNDPEFLKLRAIYQNGGGLCL